MGCAKILRAAVSVASSRSPSAYAAAPRILGQVPPSRGAPRPSEDVVGEGFGPVSKLLRFATSAVALKQPPSPSYTAALKPSPAFAAAPKKPPSPSYCYGPSSAAAFKQPRNAPPLGPFRRRLTGFPSLRPLSARNFSTTGASSVRALDLKTGTATCVLPVGAVVDTTKTASSCWACAAVGAVESINAIRGNKLIKLSEQQVLDCNNLSNDGFLGGYAHLAFDYIVRNGGLVSADVYPYIARQSQCHKLASYMVTIDSYQFVPRNDEYALMKAVANQPVVVDVSYCKEWERYDGGIIYGEGGELNHQVLCVAYGTFIGEKVWMVKDSGGNGYVRIARDVGWKGGAAGIAKNPCFPIKNSPNRNGIVDDDLSLYAKIYLRPDVIVRDSYISDDE